MIMIMTILFSFLFLLLLFVPLVLLWGVSVSVVAGSFGVSFQVFQGSQRSERSICGLSRRSGVLGKY